MAAQAEEHQQSSRQESILGMAMSRTMTGPFVTPASPRADVSDRIVQRYADVVRATEARRLTTFVPLDQRETVKPCDRQMVRSMKRELDAPLKQAGSDVVVWEKVVGQEPFQKQLQFLHGHAKTGEFVERYGSDGSFRGELLFGMRHGTGRHDFRGEVYEGDWKWDMRHGFGSLTLGDGSQVKGEWEAGKPHGYISVIDATGTTTYEGEFRHGKRHGLGRQIFASGDMYDGGWREGRLHDRGVYYFANGDKLYGMWNMGQYDGIGVFHYSDGSISRRVYKDGVLMSVQDYQHSSQRFGKMLHREGMLRHTADRNFPKEVFMLSSV